jgi:hypothetical protein
MQHQPGDPPLTPALLEGDGLIGTGGAGVDERAPRLIGIGVDILSPLRCLRWSLAQLRRLIR